MWRILAGALAFYVAGEVWAQKPASKGKNQQGASIIPDPLEFKPGEALSARALVTRPPVLKGVVSWSLETRKHRGSFSATTLSPDGKLYATGGLDGTIRIWESDSAKLVRALIGHNSYCYGLAFSPDGRTLASAGSFDATVRLWDVRTGMPLKILKGHPTYVVQVVWSPDGRQVAAAGGQSGNASYWDAFTGKHLGTVDVGRPITGIAWHPEGKRVAIAAPMLAIALWDMDANKIGESYGDANAEFHSVAWSPNGKTLAAGAGTHTFLFDETGKEDRKLEGQGFAVAWSSDGKSLATSDNKAGKINVWNSESGVRVKELSATAYTLAFLPGDQKLIASGSYAYIVAEIAAAKILATHEIGGSMPPLWWVNRPLVTGVGTAKLLLWDQSNGRLLRTLTGHKSAIAAVVWSPDGKLLATASYDKSVKLWDASTGSEVRTLEGHDAPVRALAFSNDGKWIASAGTGKVVLIHEASTGTSVQALKGHVDQVNALAWAPGSSGLLVSGSSDKTAKLWNPRTTAKEVRTLEDAGVIHSVAWSPDGKIVITGHDDDRARTWQASSGKLLHVLETRGSPPQVTSLAWSPNDLMLASGRGNHTLQIWNTRTAQLIHSLPTMAPVARISWTPGSTTVIASNTDRTTRFFDAVSGQLRALLLAEEKQIIAVSADGHYRTDAGLSNELIYVAQLEKSQETFLPNQFSTKFHFKNLSSRVILTGK